MSKNLHPSPTARTGFLPSNAVTKGIHRDVGAFSANKDVYCKQCGFPCNLDRDSRGVDSFAGESITSGNLLTNGSFETWSGGAPSNWNIDDLYTKLLLHFNGTDGSTTFTDSSYLARTVTAVGNAQLDTAQYKFGTASGLFDGTGDYLTAVDSDDWYFGRENFTIDTQIRFNDLTIRQSICGQYVGINPNWTIYKESIANGNKLYVTFSDGITRGNYHMKNDWSVSADTWYHLAFVRHETSALIFIDGTSQALTQDTSFGANDVGDLSSVLYIGQYGEGSYHFNGWMDEFRISKGIARWTEDFTAPTLAYGDITGISQETASGYFDDSDDGVNSLKITRNGSDIVLSQNISNPSNFNSNIVSFRARVKSSTDEVIRLKLRINSSNYYSSYNIAQQNFQDLYVTVKCPSSVSEIGVEILSDNANGTAYIDQAILARSGNTTTVSAQAGCPHCSSYNYF